MYSTLGGKTKAWLLLQHGDDIYRYSVSSSVWLVVFLIICGIEMHADVLMYYLS